MVYCGVRRATFVFILLNRYRKSSRKPRGLIKFFDLPEEELEREGCFSERWAKESFNDTLSRVMQLSNVQFLAFDIPRSQLTAEYC